MPASHFLHPSLRGRHITNLLPGRHTSYLSLLGGHVSFSLSPVMFVSSSLFGACREREDWVGLVICQQVGVSCALPPVLHCLVLCNP
jgi:hypothetical protein